MTKYTNFNVNAQDQNVTRNLVREVKTSYFVYGLSPDRSAWKNFPCDTIDYTSLKDVASAIIRYAEDQNDLVIKSISLGAGRVNREDALTIRANSGFNGVFRRTLTREEGIDLARKIEEAREQ